MRGGVRALAGDCSDLLAAVLAPAATGEDVRTPLDLASCAQGGRALSCPPARILGSASVTSDLSCSSVVWSGSRAGGQRVEHASERLLY